MLQWIRSNGRTMALLHSGRKYRNHTGRFDKGSGNYILNKRDYYMARKSWGISIRLDWFLLGRDFATWIDSKETATSREILYSKVSKFHTNRFGLGTIYYSLTSLIKTVPGNIGSRLFLYRPRRARSVYCHDLRPIFPSRALALGYSPYAKTYYFNEKSTARLWVV